MEPSEDQDLQNIYEYTCRVCMVTDNKKRFHTLLEEPLKSQFEECTSIEVIFCLHRLLNHFQTRPL